MQMNNEKKEKHHVITFKKTRLVVETFSKKIGEYRYLNLNLYWLRLVSELLLETIMRPKALIARFGGVVYGLIA